MVEHQKVAFASLHFTGPVDHWYQALQIGKFKTRWAIFVEDLCASFKETSYKDIVAEFEKLQQTRTGSNYQDKFEELIALMLERNCHLFEDYFVSSFLVP